MTAAATTSPPSDPSERQSPVDTAFSAVDARQMPPRVQVPRLYNAAVDFVDRHLAEGRAGAVAMIDDAGSTTYGALAARVNRAAGALAGLGVRPESRVAMILLDSADFPTAFWGAMKAGAVPVPLNTLLTTQDYAYMLGDCRARAVVVSAALWAKVAPAIEGLPEKPAVLISTAGGGEVPAGAVTLATALEGQAETFPAHPTTADDVAFWLYSSGSTGAPKGVMHLHGNIVETCGLYATGVLGLTADDVVFSAAKLFFAYGLGNALTFPFHVGATAVVTAERPTPAAVMRVLKQHRPTVFYGVPTLYGAMLADPANTRAAGSDRLRICVSAGEALPEHVGRRWEERFGVAICDGLGSTEMLHIFLSNRPDDVRYGSTGKPVPGYACRLVDEEGQPVAPGEMGELVVSGPSAAMGYWNQREKSLRTFRGPWTHTGDKYVQDADGYFHCAGRADDMLKVSGNWVSPFEVEAALAGHEAVLEAAVVGWADADGLIKPKAFVVLKPGQTGSDTMASALKDHVKGALAPYKYPRWIEFVDELPKTATGKIQRFKLRRGPE